MGKSWDDFSKGQEKQQKMFEKNIREGKKDKYNRQPGCLPDINVAMAANQPIYNFEGMIEFFTPIWKEVYRVMKPGAFGFIMCIPRQDCLSRMMISL